MIKAVLFDMDGVIIDSEPIHRKAYFQMFSEVGIDVPEEEYESYTGKSTISICEKLCANYKLPQTPEELVAIKRKYFYDIFDNDPSVHLIEGVLALIQNYYENGLKLVLASSASMRNINSVFKRFDLDKYFIGKVSGAELKESKPHPEIFEKASEMTGFSRKECMVIEDSTNGIQASHSAGVFCVAFKSPHSEGQNYDLANLVISDFKEIYYEKLEGIL
ncbi:MAG: HAD family phosphatase [Flavobacteriaceae bacterium]|nr:HAD family phosphatase [Flavobacteriaceae bacterium]